MKSSNNPFLDPMTRELLAECPYELGMLIGEGGMARVYLGTHRRTGRQAAIKVPKGSPWAFDRFRQEIDAMDRLDHMHVMPLLEVDRQRRWYAMPWALFSLRELWERDPSNWPQLLKALSSVTGAMMHAHSNGCIHRDASPDNLLKLRNGHWVLSDFGIAKLWRAGRPRTEAVAKFGTPEFSAPEVHSEPANVTPAADAWSVGALVSWFTSIRSSQRPTSLVGIQWHQLIEGTMQKDPSMRWSMNEIASHLNTMAATRVPVFTGVYSDQCPRCHRSAGVDAVSRCLACGFPVEG